MSTEDYQTAAKKSRMATAQETTNKATFARFHDAINTGNAEVISRTVDEVVDPNVENRAYGPGAWQEWSIEAANA